MGGFAKRCNPKLAHVHVDKTNTALGVAAWKAGVRPIAAPAPLPEGGVRKTDSGAGWRDDRSPAGPRLSVEGGAFVGQELCLGRPVGPSEAGFLMVRWISCQP
jgi:hypothetical protein